MRSAFFSGVAAASIALTLWIVPVLTLAILATSFLVSIGVMTGFFTSPSVNVDGRSIFFSSRILAPAT